MIFRPCYPFSGRVRPFDAACSLPFPVIPVAYHYAKGLARTGANSIPKIIERRTTPTSRTPTRRQAIRLKAAMIAATTALGFEAIRSISIDVCAMAARVNAIVRVQASTLNTNAL